MDSYITKILQSWNMRGVLAVGTVAFLKIAWRFSSVNPHVAARIGLDERTHPLLGRAKMHAYDKKKSSEIMHSSACASSHVYGVDSQEHLGLYLSRWRWRHDEKRGH